MRIALIVLITLILSLGIVPALSIDDAFALKSKGKPLREINSNQVCGDRLCSEMIKDEKTSFSSHSKEIKYECSSDFWKDNLELWDDVGLDYNDDFDETFGRNYFEPDITLEQAINMNGVGMTHLARAGTAAYLNALSDPEIDEEIVRSAVNFGYIHQIENYVANCKNVEK